MSNMIVSHHGFDFGIDTADWGNNESTAAKAADRLETWLRSLNPEQAAVLHADMKAFVAGDFDEPTTMMRWATQAGSTARAQAMAEDNWLSSPDSGHNCDLYAA